MSPTLTPAWRVRWIIGAHLVALVALLLPPTRRADAYPVQRPPLRKLVAQADTIVLGKTVAIEDAPGRRDTPAEAVVEIAETLKAQGRPSTGSVRTGLRVSFEPRMTCPSPPDFKVGQTVLLFLRAVEGGGGRLWTVAVGHGLKDVGDAEERSAYLARTREAVALAAEAPGPERDARTVEWLLRCVESPATLWEGAVELVAAGSGRAGDAGLPAIELTPAQKDRVIAALIALPEGIDDWGARLLLRVAARTGDRRVVRWSRAQLETSTSSYSVLALMETLSEVLSWREGAALAREHDDASDPKLERLILDRFVAGLDEAITRSRPR